MNTGLINKLISPKDWVYKSLSPLICGSPLTDGDWESYLPVTEKQNSNGFDTMACVTYSLSNVFETHLKAKFGIDRNFSDRFLAKVSGTGPNGNFVYSVADALCNIGTVDQYIYPNEAKDWAEFYKNVTPELISKAKELLSEYEIYYEYVLPDNNADIMDALNYSPLQVTVKYADGLGILNPKGKWQHAVMLFKYERNKCWYIFDHYNQTIKRYAWDYRFGSILKLSINKKSNNSNSMIVQNNFLYQLVEGGGGFALGLDGQLVIDELSKINATFMVRNNGNTTGKVKAIKLVDWNSVPHVNLKGEPVQ